ncbi:hypothetical protein COI73_17350 [Bacillus cereus]|nr:hypothetical protein COI73_17350 [Bacillus cereus]
MGEGIVGIKLAVLIGVSQYEKIDNLDACLRDVKVMHELIKQTNSYQDILFISDNTNSEHIKLKIVEFFKKHKEAAVEVDQVLFYFTGHGKAIPTEVHYLLSDFDPQKMKSTTLENSEVDNYLRMLNPKLAVKVIDACYSGVSYIKDGDEQIIERNFRASAEGRGLKDCYFMFSSQNTETSHAQGLSYFTESFIDAVLQQQDQTTIRFKDIMDRVSDTFNTIYKGEQTPQFVSQANYTEEFCLVTPELKQRVDEAIKGTGATAVKEAEASPKMPLLDFIKGESQDYCTDFNEILTAFEAIRSRIDSMKLSSELQDLYELNIQIGHMTEHVPAIDKFDSISAFLEKKQSDYFVKVLYEEATKSRNPLFDSPGVLLGHRKKIVDFSPNNGNVPFDYITIEFKAKYPILKSYKCSILIFLSRLNLMIIDTFAPYQEVGWEEYATDEKEAKWQIRERKIKVINLIKQTIDFSLVRCEKFILNDVTNLYESKNGAVEEKKEGSVFIAKSKKVETSINK